MIKQLESYSNTTWFIENPLNQSELNSFTFEEIQYIIHNKGKRPPNKYKDWIKLLKQKKCPESLDYYQQIFEDFSPFFELKNGKTVSKITKQMLEKILNSKNFDILRVRNHKCQWSTKQRYRLEPYINELSEFMPKNIDFPFNPYDEEIIIPSDDGNTEKPYKNINDVFERNECLRNTYNNNQTKMSPGSIAYNHGSFIEPTNFRPIPEFLPVWSWGKRDCFKDILYPIPEALSNSNFPIKWECKESKVIWRGTTTGTYTSSTNNYRLSHRYRLVDWAKNQSEYVFNNLGIEVDVGFSKVIQCEKDYCQKVKSDVGISPYLSRKGQTKSKYIIVVDGNSWAFRMITNLGSNSVVFYNGIFTVWFSKLIKPFVHYVPFKADFSDLTEKLEYAKNHDEEMKKIAENARKFIDELITPNTVSCYLALLIIEYLGLVEHLD